MNDKKFPTPKEILYYLKEGREYTSPMMEQDYRQDAADMQNLPPSPLRDEFIEWWYDGKPYNRVGVAKHFKTEVRGITFDQLLRWRGFGVIHSLLLFSNSYLDPDNEEHFTEISWKSFLKYAFFPTNEYLKAFFKDTTPLADNEIDRHVKTLERLKGIDYYDSARYNFMHWIIVSLRDFDLYLEEIERPLTVRGITVKHIVEKQKIAPIHAFSLLIRLYFDPENEEYYQSVA